MRRAQVLELASEQSGLQAKDHHIQHGLKTGQIEPAPSISGWRVYSDKHVTQLVEYLKRNACRRGLKVAGGRDA